MFDKYLIGNKKGDKKSWNISITAKSGIRNVSVFAESEERAVITALDKKLIKSEELDFVSSIVLEGGRKLTSKQKKLIEEFYNSNKDAFEITCDSELFKKLESINDYETLLMDAERYMRDIKMEDMYGKKVKGADQYEPSDNGKDDCLSYRETFDNLKKAEKKIASLKKEGYIVKHFTKYTKENQEPWWEIEADLPPTPKTDTKYKNELTMAEPLKAVKASEIRADEEEIPMVEQLPAEELPTDAIPEVEEKQELPEPLKEDAVVEEEEETKGTIKLTVYKVDVSKAVEYEDGKYIEKKVNFSDEKLDEQMILDILQQVEAKNITDPKEIEAFTESYYNSKMGELEKPKSVDKEVEAGEETNQMKVNRLNEIDKVMQEHGKLIDAYYNPIQGQDQKFISAKIETLTKRLEGLQDGSIKITADPAVASPLIDPVKDQEPIEPSLKQTTEPVKESTKKDSFDVTGGIALGNGYIAHKEGEDIYVMDKSGQEVFRAPKKGFVDDVASLIETLRGVLNIKGEIPKEGEQAPAPEGTPEVPEGEEAPVSETPKPDTVDEQVSDIYDKVEELYDMQVKQPDETNDEEKLEDQVKNVAELAEIKKDIDQKSKEVNKTLKSLMDNKQIMINRKDIQAFIIAGENPIFAKKKAMQEKLKRFAKKLYAMDMATIKTIQDVLIGVKDKDNNSDAFMFLKD